MKSEKPASITITVRRRSRGKDDSDSFTVYDTSVKEVVKKIKKCLNSV